MHIFPKLVFVNINISLLLEYRPSITEKTSIFIKKKKYNFTKNAFAGYVELAR